MGSPKGDYRYFIRQAEWRHWRMAHWQRWRVWYGFGSGFVVGLAYGLAL